jgi:hypothetical protein
LRLATLLGVGTDVLRVVDWNALRQPVRPAGTNALMLLCFNFWRLDSWANLLSRVAPMPVRRMKIACDMHMPELAELRSDYEM